MLYENKFEQSQNKISGYSINSKFLNMCGNCTTGNKIIDYKKR